ncbi:hypothetical protein CspHIS471_0506670 [Cutaneotrichosporon sp. HIS471]|nr:hypothetical protein CspHIS471_0506670 [Cutaneotrichosporon sp. HIS471]
MAAKGASPANPSTAGSAPAPADPETRNAVNARVIGRKDAFFTEIVENAGIATLYNYIPSVGTYVKQPAMGPLFLIRRTKAPEYALYMINRSGPKNHFWGLYPTEMRITAHDKDKVIEVARRGEPERPRFWLDESVTLRPLYDRIQSIVGPPVKPDGSAKAGGNAVAPSSAQTSQPSSHPAVQPPAQPTAQPQIQQPPPGQNGLAQLFAGLGVVSGPNAAPPVHNPQPHPHSAGTQQPPYPQYPQQPPQNPHHYTANVAPFVGPQAPYSHYSSSPVPGHSDSSTPQPPAPPPMAPKNFAPHETADGLFKSLLGGVASFPTYGQPSPVSNSGAVPAPPATSGSPVRAPPGLGPGPPMPGGPPQRGFPSAPHHGGGPGPTNGHTSPPHNQPQPQSPFYPQSLPPNLPANPSPEGMRDALLSTMGFPPENKRPQPMVSREQLIGTMVQLLQTNPNFCEDVYRAYLARNGGGPRQ